MQGPGPTDFQRALWPRFARAASRPDPRSTRSVVLLAFLAAAQGCSPRSPAPAVPPAPVASRAVLVSVDGMGGERLARLLGEPGKLPAGGLRRLVDTGFFAERSVPSTPSLTPAAHATHVTGASPRDTGIVGNSLLDFGKPFGTKRSGFDTPLRAETLCEAARRQGKRVGVVAYPHAAGTPASGCAGFGMNWNGDPISPARLARLDGRAWKEAPGPASQRTFSPARHAILDFPPTAHHVEVVALDSTDDSRANYDRLLVRPEAGPEVVIETGRWFAAEIRGEKGRAGAWCKLLSLTPDLSRTEVYLGETSETEAYPEDFRRSIDARAGFWPGRASQRFFGPDSDRTDSFVEQSERLTAFLETASLIAAERRDWDLLFLYFSEVDATEHAFLLTSPRQSRYTPERAARFGELIDAAFARADEVIARLQRLLTPRDALFVTADHGMTPLRLEVYPDEILRRAGLLSAAPDGSIDPSSAAVAMATSGTTHVYVNPAAPSGTLDAVERLLSEFQVDGESPWDRMARRESAADLTLDAPESGDLILLAVPGVHLSMRVNGPTSGPAEEYGGHGYRAVYRDLDATFLAAGPGVPRGRADQISSTTIAARIAAALGIEPPRNAERLPR